MVVNAASVPHRLLLLAAEGEISPAIIRAGIGVSPRGAPQRVFARAAMGQASGARQLPGAGEKGLPGGGAAQHTNGSHHSGRSHDGGAHRGDASGVGAAYEPWIAQRALLSALRIA